MGRVCYQQHCTALHCTALNCAAVHCTALHCTDSELTLLQWSGFSVSATIAEEVTADLVEVGAGW